MNKLQLAVLGSSLDTYANRFWTQVARMQTRHIPKPIISFLYWANELSQGFKFERMGSRFRFCFPCCANIISWIIGFTQKYEFFRIIRGSKNQS